MKTKSKFILLFILGLSLVACEQPKTASTAVVEQTVAAVEIPKYSAQAFFETTSYGLVDPAGYAFSPDGKPILMYSDATGVFHAYALPLDGKA